jgi:hypothetical protein
VEQHLGAVAAGILEDRGEVAAGDFDVLAVICALQRERIYPGCHSATSVDEPHAANVGGGIADAGHDAHAFGDVGRLPPDVDRTAAGALAGRQLDDSHGHAVARKPVSERHPGDARARNQDVESLHVAPRD